MSKKIDYEDMMKCYQHIQEVLNRVGLKMFLKEMPEQLHQQLFKFGIRKNSPVDYHDEKKKVW